MKVILAFLVLFGFSFDFAHKCDFYFVGNVDYRGRGKTVGKEDSSLLQGCKKGCFFNATYTDDGVPKCQKCKEITDEEQCLRHTATCQWKKKCKSQSCPGIAKARVALYGSDINDNSTREALYRQQIKIETECIEGSALEQKFNKLYLDDYLATYNYQYAVWNQADTCTLPRSTYAGNTYSWANVVTNNAGTNAGICAKFIGYNYIANTGNPLDDRCDPVPCLVNDPIDPDTNAPNPSLGTTSGFQTACQNIPGCIFVRGTGNGYGCTTEQTGCGTGQTRDQCLVASNPNACTMSGTGGSPRWEAGKNTSSECTTDRPGCMFVPGPGGTENNGAVSSRDRDENGLTEDDQCIPLCSPFTAGTTTRKECEQLGCTYTGGDKNQREGTLSLITNSNQKTAEDKDNCNAARLVSASRPAYLPILCGINETLDLEGYHTNDVCVDRAYGPAPGCSIPAYITEEDCKNGRGTWTRFPKTCRTLYSTARSVCEFQARDVQNEVVYVKGLSSHGGNLRPGTQYEKCVQDGYDETDEFKVTTVTLYEGAEVMIPAFLTPEDRENIYGYRTPEEYCQHQLDVRLEDCQREYETAVQAACHQPIIDQQLEPGSWEHNSVQVRASRSACHRIYGCMYSRSNERCSVWSVWAFILTLILVILVAVVGLGVGAIILLPIIKKSSA